MDLQELRREIDRIDDELIRLLQKRMDVSANIAKYKKQNNIPVYDPAREQQKLQDLSDNLNERYKTYIIELYSLIFELSRTEQGKIMNMETDI